jgi:hypothetical protein
MLLAKGERLGVAPGTLDVSRGNLKPRDKVKDLMLITPINS